MTIETRPWTTGQKAALGALLAVQAAAAYAIGTSEVLANTTQSFFAPIAISATVPVALFVAAYAGSARFRNFALSQDVRTLTMLHLWRIIGFVFLALYAIGHLPAVFAIPAGVGDVAVGIAAFFVMAPSEPRSGLREEPPVHLVPLCRPCRLRHRDHHGGARLRRNRSALSRRA